MSGPFSDDVPTRPVEFTPIGRVESPFHGKFGAPRQPGLVPAAVGRVVLFPPWNCPDAFRGIDGFSHLWLVFLADRIPQDEQFRPLVRPPRLGGNEKAGVFATRALFRPNRIGLSLVRLLEVVPDGAGGSALRVGGIDLVDGTPLLDVKPYLPYAEAVPGAAAAFAGSAPPEVAVEFTPAAAEQIPGIEAGRPGFSELLRQTLAADPRPAVQNSDHGKSFAFELDGVAVRFHANPDGSLRVVDLRWS